MNKELIAESTINNYYTNISSAGDIADKLNLENNDLALWFKKNKQVYENCEDLDDTNLIKDFAKEFLND